jgi:hypothetical protein
VTTALFQLIDSPSAPDDLTSLDSVQAEFGKEELALSSLVAPGVNRGDETRSSDNFAPAIRGTHADQNWTYMRVAI